MKNTIIVVVLLAILGVGGYALYASMQKAKAPAQENTLPQGEQTQPETTAAAATTTQTATQNSPTTVIGTSAGGAPITAYHYGTGSDEILFVGGIHGGYEWNTALVAYDLMDYLAKNPDVIPQNEKVTVIPVLNPDGLQKVVEKTGPFTAADVSAKADTVAGRFNANTVDLNRNFDCDWQATGTWQDKKVSGGSAAFSEPESQAVKTYVESHNPKAVVVWYSAAGGVFASNCHDGVLSDTQKLVDTYAKASGYPAHESFDFYTITGDMVNWLAKIGTPGISVLLTNHTDAEWSKNQKGVEAVLKYFAK